MVRSYPVHQVSVRDAWADDWSPVPYLYCNGFTASAAPEIPAAEFEYRFGDGQRAGLDGRAEYSPAELGGKFVKIETTGLPNWYGFITEPSTEREGAIEVAEVKKGDGSTEAAAHRLLTGVEHYTAFGLEYLLDRVPILESKVDDGEGGVKTIGRAIAFNAGDGFGSRSRPIGGNMTTTLGPDGVTLFASSLTAASSAEWNAGLIVAYLLNYFSPKNSAGEVSVPFQLDYSTAYDSLKWSAPMVAAEGRTVLDILNQLINRKRGLGWNIEIDEPANEVKIVVFTFATQDVELPSGQKLKANKNQGSLDIDLDDAVDAFELRRSETDRFDQVVVRGARRGSVLTLSKEDGTIDADWSSDLESNYELGASTSAAYTAAAGDASIEAALNTDARKRDEVARVFSWFALAQDFSGDVGDGEAGAFYRAFPTLDSNGDPTATGSEFWRPGLRFESYLPFLEGHDYSGSKIADGTVADNNPAGSSPEFLEPFVVFEVASNRWVHSEHMGEAADSGDSDREQTWSANVSTRKDDAGLIVKVVGGHQHYLASADFDELSGESFETEQFVNWREMIAVVYVLSDDHVEARYPADADVATVDVLRQLVLTVEDAHLDYCPEDTVVAVSHGSTLTRTTEAGFVRDDRERLDDIARAAWEWHGSSRVAINVSKRGLSADFIVGHLITTIGGDETEETVNSVITKVEFDLVNDRLEFSTSFANLDFEA